MDLAFREFYSIYFFKKQDKIFKNKLRSR